MTEGMICTECGSTPCHPDCPSLGGQVDPPVMRLDAPEDWDDDCKNLWVKLQKTQERMREARLEKNEMISKYKEALENIREYNLMLPLHTNDPHALHFNEQIEFWCQKILDA